MGKGKLYLISINTNNQITINVNLNQFNVLSIKLVIQKNII